MNVYEYKLVTRNGVPLYKTINGIAKLWIAKVKINPPDGLEFLFDNDANILTDDNNNYLTT